MASIRRRRGSKNWTACITLPNGKQRQFSTRTDDEALAREIAVRAENALRPNRARGELLASLQSIADEVGGQTSEPVSAWLISWARRRALEVGDATGRKYRTIADEAAQWVRERAGDSFPMLSRRLVDDLRGWWSERNSPATANQKTKILRMALRDAVREGLLSENPAEGLRALRSSGNVRRAFSIAEVRALLEVADEEWRALLVAACCYGPRRNDLIRLRWASVDLAREEIQFKTAKTGKPVLLPIIAPVSAALEKLPCSDDPRAFVFPTIGGMTGNAVSLAFYRLMERAGLVDKRPKPKRGDPRKGSKPSRRKTNELSFHSLRYTANSFLKSAGVPDAVVMAIVGHQTKAMSDHYTGFDAATLRAAMERAELQSLFA